MATKQTPQPLVVFDTDPSILLENLKTALEAVRRSQDHIVSTVKPDTATFKTVLLPLAHTENIWWNARRQSVFLKSVSPDKALRDAANVADKLVKEFEIECSMRSDVFELVDAVLEKNEQSLDPEDRFYLEKKHRGFLRNGLQLPPGPKLERFKEVKKRIGELVTVCQQNFNEEGGGLWWTREELEGVPDDTVKGFKEGQGENAGKLWATFKRPDYQPILSYAQKEETRKRAMLGWENKCEVNEPFVTEMYLLKDEAARLLGYPNYAALKISDKMVKSPKTVNDFLDDLRRRMEPGAQLEREKYYALKSADLKARGLEPPDDGRVYLWDTAYYNRVLKEQEHSFDQRKVAEYFPLDESLRRMFATFSHLLGVRFETYTPEALPEVDNKKGKALFWHEDVKCFTVWDTKSEGGGFLGYLYLDLHPRAFKFPHNGHFQLNAGYVKPDGTRYFPSSVLMCNFTNSTEDKPSLLKHRECVSAFHELGHALHNLVSRTKYAFFHGVNVSRDFVETPSKMLENWYWLRSQLKDVSCHYTHLSPKYMEKWTLAQQKDNPGKAIEEPPQQIPEELITAILDSRNTGQAIAMLRQLHAAMFDMAVHQPISHEAIEKENFAILYNKLRFEITGLYGPENLDWSKRFANFHHIWNNQEAGYYSYITSESYAADMFYTQFQDNPMSAEVGRRYRYTVLERGGSRPEMENIEEFLGRKPTNQAFLSALGLVDT